MAHVSIMMSNKVSLPVSSFFWLVGEEVMGCTINSNRVSHNSLVTPFGVSCVT